MKTESIKVPIAKWKTLFLVPALLSGIFNLSGAERSAFELRPTDVVVFVGGEDVVGLGEAGMMELMLGLDAAGSWSGTKFRNLGWEGDTVYRQPRELNFGNWREQLRRAEATVLFAQFGKTEALEGTEGLASFTQAYDTLIEEWLQHTERVVLLSPTPFEATSPLTPDLASKNGDLSAYVEAIRAIADRRGLPFVDLFHPLRTRPPGAPSLTRDGHHLNMAGHYEAARATVQQLGMPIRLESITWNPTDHSLRPMRLDKARRLILQKNRLWFDYWRPMNWAFLAGDRTEQPSSRDHRDPSVRWFPQEMQEFLPLIERQEAALESLLQQP